MPGLRGALALLAATVVGCFEPSLGDGQVQCGANGLCPPGLSCDARNVCVEVVGPGGDAAAGDSRAGDSVAGDVRGDGPRGDGPRGDGNRGDTLTGDLRGGDVNQGDDAPMCPGSVAILAMGPIRYYRLDDTAGTAAVDATGNADGAYSGTAGADFVRAQPNPRACDANPAVRFLGNQHALRAPDSTGGYIDGGVMPLTTPFHVTLSVWFRPQLAAVDSFPTVSRVVAMGRANSDYLSFYHDSYADPIVPASWVMRANAGSGVNTPATYSAAFGTGQWHHIAATYDGSQVAYYRDGELENTAVTTTYSAGEFDNAELGIGAASGGFNQEYSGRFDGWIDEVVIFDRVLTAIEVRQLYQATAGLP